MYVIFFRIAIDLISQHIADYLANPQTSRLAQPESPAVVALMDTRKRSEKLHILFFLKINHVFFSRHFSDTSNMYDASRRVDLKDVLTRPH